MLFVYGSVTVPPDWHVEEASAASYCRIYYVRSGHVIYRDDRTVRLLLPDHLYVFPSARPYKMEQDPSRPLNCLFLHLDVSPYLLTDLLELPVEKDTFLFHLLNGMDTWISDHSFQAPDPVMEAMAGVLVPWLNSRNLLQLVPEKLADTILYIYEHIHERLTVETLSDLVGYHPQYYIRLFRTYTGITPHQYIINARMNLALSELMSGKSVSDTADTVGYPEVRNFIRAFRKYYGYSPGQIKKLTLPVYT